MLSVDELNGRRVATGEGVDTRPICLYHDSRGCVGCCCLQASHGGRRRQHYWRPRQMYGASLRRAGPADGI
jgi:hypothetical protein